MDIKQTSPNNQSATDLGQTNEIINSSLISRFSVRTMAKDLETLAKRSGQDQVSLYVKPEASRFPTPTPPVPPIKQAPQEESAASVPKPAVPPQTIRATSPPVDLPIAKPAPAPAPVSVPKTEPPVAPVPEPTLPTELSAPEKTGSKKLLLTIIIVAIILLLGLAGWFLWRSFGPVLIGTPTPSLTQTPSPTPSFSSTPIPVVLPQPPFNMEKQQSIDLVLDQKSPLSTELQPLASSADGGTFTQVAFKTTPEGEQARLLTLDEFDSFFNLTSFGPIIADNASSSTPSANTATYLRDLLDQNQYFPFVYYQTQDGNSPFSGGLYPARFGLIAALKTDAKAADAQKILKNLEPTMPEELKDLLVFANSSVEVPESPKFIDNTYKNIQIRYMNFPFSTLTLDYAIDNNYFLLTTSKEAMYAAIDRLLTATATSTKGDITGDMSDWQTYHNDSAGYEIEYPSGGSVEGAFNIAPLTPKELASAGDITITISAAKNSEGILLQAYPIDTTLEKHISDSIQNKDIVSQGTELIGGLTAKSFTINGVLSRISNGVTYESMEMTPQNKILFLEKNGMVYRFIFGNTGITDNDQNTINQILSTFKFTK